MDTILRLNDEQLTVKEIASLEKLTDIISLFTHFGYNTHAQITKLSDRGITPKLADDIHAYHVAMLDNQIKIYLFEVRSLTKDIRKKIASSFRQMGDNIIFILTKNYDEFEFVLLDKSNPIPLLVNRKLPDPVAMRTLREFFVTDRDIDADVVWKRLRDAYNHMTIGTPYFIDRLLFSDHYLLSSLPSDEVWKNTDIRPIGYWLRDEFITKQQAITAKSAPYEALFRELGFTPTHQPQSATDPQATPIPTHYRLADKHNTDTPIALAMTYDWGRNLDDIDSADNSIPGADVVTLLEQAATPTWVILTNGNIWRLYSSTVSNKATTYYQVSLTEAFDTNDQITALKYWFLMFRAEAFTGFLDKARKDSLDHAIKLRNQLKKRVFEDIFPKFANGFFTDMKHKGGHIESTDEVALGHVFTGTMTFLYRLMFILYAESLEMFSHEAYIEHSLYKLKHDIQDIAKSLIDNATNLIEHAYSDTDTTLYNRLQTLFVMIDKGSQAHNMPVYNGGLFSPNTPDGQFLTDYAVPDRFLALGFDKLTRDIDPKTLALAFVDFKSLEVRHLGSIYEGLLEFKLRIKQIAEKDVLYLEKDKRERKATGSYYTPDYIVSYIVQHAVGPVLDRKFEALRPRLRKAQSDFIAYEKLVVARKKSHGVAESADVFWNTPAMVQLADDCLNIRVLDPAMGSGHFLVTVVDYISNRLIDFLNGWSDNPVWAFLEQTKRDIQTDMHRQTIAIDVSKLTRMNLLRRAVLKRCVYGVDLNKMAVELAKVSLWLNAFTLGAPLSFLDHHLKWGNSLIGAMDLSDVVLKDSDRWNGILDAATKMVELSNRSDSTIVEVDLSKSDYESVLAQLEDKKKYANVPIASYFVDELNEYRKSKKNRDMVTTVAQIAYKVQSDYLQPLYDRAQATAHEKRFFHWKLEFPEVFIDLEKREWSKDGGFDAVVGNPPYDEISEFYSNNSHEETNYFTYAPTFINTRSGRINLYRLFLIMLSQWLSKQAYASFITPLTILSDSYSYGTRKYLFQTLHLEKVDAFPQKDDINKRVFPEAKQSTCILLLQKIDVINAKTRVTTHRGRYIEEDSPSYVALQETLFRFTPNQHAIPLVSDSQWYILENFMYPENGSMLADYANIYAGEMCDNKLNAKYLSDDAIGPKILRGGNVQRYELIEDAKQGKPRYLNQELWFAERSESKRGGHYENYRIVFQKGAAVDNWRRLIATVLQPNEFCFDTIGYMPFSELKKPYTLLALLNSSLWDFRFSAISTTNHINAYELDIFYVPNLEDVTPADERQAQTTVLISAYKDALATDNSAEFLNWKPKVYGTIANDVIHDFLAYLAERMIALNQQKQGEVNRFLEWVMKTMRLKAGKSLDNLEGKTILQGYLGDYQKEQGETTWKEFHYRLYQNQGKFDASLTDVEEKICVEYEKSLAVLRPIKYALEQTDVLIDKIVYRLYGLTDEEIELIERPQFIQGLADARAEIAKIPKDKVDDEARAGQLSEGYLVSARRNFAMLDPQQVAQELDKALPNWENLHPDASSSLLTGDYILNIFPDDMDFSPSISSYAKAVEVAVTKQIFEPFRKQYTEADCTNRVLKDFMLYKQKLTLGHFIVILPSSDEPILRDFVGKTVSNLVEFLKLFRQGSDIGAKRNNAVHNTAFKREDVLGVRDWTISVLRTI